MTLVMLWKGLDMATGAADRLTGQQLAGAFAIYTMDAVDNITVKHKEGSVPMTMTYNAASQ